jgi:hypothetical protein
MMDSTLLPKWNFTITICGDQIDFRSHECIMNSDFVQYYLKNSYPKHSIEGADTFLHDLLMDMYHS